MPSPLYGLYERRLLRQLDSGNLPHHIGIILDGNRRWAKAVAAPAAHGHRAGAEKILEVLGWSDAIGVKYVTLWMLSTDNLRRDPEELQALVAIIEEAVSDLAATRRWRIQALGASGLLPPSTAKRLEAAQELTRDVEGMTVNVAVGYGGRQEIADAVRGLLRERAEAGASLQEVARELTAEQIAEHLYTKGQPDPDLVIRTSGEQRLGGFLLWQSVHSEFYFCEAYWPDFRRVDFLRAVREYSHRERRLGR
ncbi:isoprenyl transferase [Serinibacter salmoneus]|uniref:Isoprenyl transferase n=1 Tax=Serinibacter salmoneus TaxID=556530 RepID=A0A2A9D268_9MICO|nr:isoprenyl transferase [Serinibacter salmoneus]PFG20426.1 undecaprenyl pyrophosphate synthetase [Serinibacter salmoneus]